MPLLELQKSWWVCSINYVVDTGDFGITDTHLSLKEYCDTNTASGRRVMRRFCGDCGSPVSTESSNIQGKLFVKASLFDDLSKPCTEVFTDRRESWASPIKDAQQQ
ncbi:Glutathione-dependent formaldehyde-activating family GFA [Macrophomina phaseolina MS6]|uniref:Glutathione-dependent formaldehyde-activating family GFA n=1 Tax=Macrophomina phaseolina (strain MS6) TaxID=1126212 RepID=K2SVI4_MACPH|nr:Glutathione-dependent formaldehyde-activating family GFA [Macrophomina phaseolina MS6]